jgi:subtilisin
MRIRHTLPSFVLPLCLLALLFGLGSIHPAASSHGKGGVTAPRFAAALEARKQANAKLTRSESAERRFQELSAKLQQTVAGTTLVIIQLNVAFTPEGELQEAGRLAQRAAIRQAQDNVLNSVFGGVPDSLKRYKYVPYMAVSVNAGELAALQASSEVLGVYEDVVIPAAQAQSQSSALIGAAAAASWAGGYTGAGKKVAILDTGVDKNHPTLAGKVVGEACYSTNMVDIDPETPDVISLCPGGAIAAVGADTGLNCTGIEGCAQGTSAAGAVANVAQGAEIIAIQINSIINSEAHCGIGKSPCLGTQISDVMNGLDRVKDLMTADENYGIVAVHISANFGAFPAACDNSSIKSHIDDLRSLGIATVVASGDEGQTNALNSPACVSSAVSVGAVGDGVSLPVDQAPNFSNSAQELKLLAPGYYATAPIPGGDAANAWGTSIAAAHVAGAWAILKQQSPKATVFELLNKLINSGTPVTDSRNNVTKPRINIDGALDCIQNVPTNRWKGEYFNNEDLSGDPVMARDDGGGTFFSKTFNGGAPDAICGPGPEKFSVKWTRKVEFAAGVYRFSVTADDGVRLYVGGALKIDAWDGPAGATRTELDFGHF